MIVGGGLAGLAAAAALGSAGFEIDLHEARPFLGGRATSFPLHPSEPDSVRIDNCQHVLLRCFTNLLDFYRRVGVDDKIHFHDKFYFVRPGGEIDVLQRNFLPAPLHLFRSLMTFRSLSVADKWSIVRTMRAMRLEAGKPELDQITIGDWLGARGATPRALERFWRPILVSALNEEPDRAAARWGVQVFAEGMLATRTSYEMGVPSIPLADLYSAALDGALGETARVHLRSSVAEIDPANPQADYYICAVPFDRVHSLLPGLELPLGAFEHSPITGIHLWYDRPITELPHAVLLDRTLQWMFRKSETCYQGVVSASRDLTGWPREKIIEMAGRELREFFPAAGGAKLTRAHVVKEVHATYSARPGLQAFRPGAATRYPNVFLAGDWTNTGWPPTMEGAVRSGYLAAEQVTRQAGCPAKFLLR